MRPIYVTYGAGFEGPKMYVIIVNKTHFGHWRVEISPCDLTGMAVSDPVEWDICPTWIDTLIYCYKLYKTYN